MGMRRGEGYAYAFIRCDPLWVFDFVAAARQLMRINKLLICVHAALLQRTKVCN